MNYTFYRDIVKGLQKSAQLEKDVALSEKTAHDTQLFNRIKAANVPGLLSRFAANPVGKGLMWGAGIGAGAALPAAAVGSYLSDTFTEDARNRALQAALGVGAVGAGLYGLHRLTQPTKQASADSDLLIEKLATVGFLDVVFEHQKQHEKNVNATALRNLNAEHGVDILRQLLNQ